MARPSRTKTPSTDDGRKEFTLDDERADQFRKAISLDDEDDDGTTKHVDAFWTQVGAEMRFDPKSIRITAKSDNGPIFLTALPIAPAPDAPIEGRGDEGKLGAEHQTAVDRLELLGQKAELDIDFLLGDVREFFLDMFKTRPRPWSACSEAEQRDIVAACDHSARDFIRQTVELVRADGRDSIRALLESYSEKDGIKATIKIKPVDEDDALAAVIGLHKAQGKHVLVTVASADDYTGQRRESEIQPDAPSMSFEGPDNNADLVEAADEPRFGVFFPETDDWLSAEEQTGDISEAGRWSQGKADELVVEFGGEVREFTHADDSTETAD